MRDWADGKVEEDVTSSGLPRRPKATKPKVIEGYRFPIDLYYHKDHSWARVEVDGKVRVGMNDFFQKMAGVIIDVELPHEGRQVKQGSPCGRIQSSKWISSIVSPVEGKVAGVNHNLQEDTTLVNKHPYGDGWTMIVKPTNLEEDLRRLMRAEELDEWLVKEIEKAKALKEERRSTQGTGRS